MNRIVEEYRISNALCMDVFDFFLSYLRLTASVRCRSPPIGFYKKSKFGG